MEICLLIIFSLPEPHPLCSPTKARLAESTRSANVRKLRFLFVLQEKDDCTINGTGTRISIRFFRHPVKNLPAFPGKMRGGD
jgi:hypothetical protein